MAGNSRYARIVDVAVYLPETRVSTEDVVSRLAELNPGLDLPRGLIAQMTGVRYLHVAPSGWSAAELAAAAAQQVLESCGRDVADIDLLIFAAASMSVLEPAMAHLVADLLGARCPVFDMRNSCNSVVNAIEVANALITAGRYRRVLIVAGEHMTPMGQWSVDSPEEVTGALVSHTASDGGAALVLEDSDDPGVLRTAAYAESTAWRTKVASLQARADGIRVGPFVVEGNGVRDLMEGWAGDWAAREVAEFGLVASEFAFVGVHQPYTDFMPDACEKLGIDERQTVPVVADHGNLASVGLPLQFMIAREESRVRRGDLVALVSFATGVSIGVAVFRW